MGKVKTVDFSEIIVACDLKVGRCRQLIEIMKVCEYWRSRSFLYHTFSRLCMFCALLGLDIRCAFTGPFVLCFLYIISDTIRKSFHLMVPYENCLICIFTNINENLEKEGKSIG